MRRDIHPEYSEVKATCSCGNIISIKTTLKEDINLDVCSSCHPFYTGKQKLVDTGGRVERFEKRFGKKAKTKKKEIAKDSNEEEVLIEEPKQEEVEEKKVKAKTKKKKSANKDKKENLENEDLKKDV